jgi:hypothetical protein
VDAPEVWLVDPVAKTGSALITLPGPYTAVTGITELTPDFFALGTGQYDLAKGSIHGTYAIWTFSLAEGTAAAQSSLKLVSKIPEAGLINGLTTWDTKSILAVDSTFGGVYKVDISAGTVTTILSDDLTKPPPDAYVPIGINGIKIRNGYIYFTNSAKQSFYRVPVDEDSATPSGPIEVVASGFANDDFAFDADGTAYIVTHPQNTLIKIAEGSSDVVTIAGKPDSIELGGGTACAFGRKADDAKTLYVVTSGALAVPVNGQREPAKIVAIDI